MKKRKKSPKIQLHLKKTSKPIYIQVAFELTEVETIDREYGSLLGIKDNYEKWIVSMDEFPLQDRNGIKNIQAWKLADELKKLG